MSFKNSSKTLTHLHLFDNHLPKSSIYPWLSNFSTSLLDLDLSLNNLQGAIPDYVFSNMTSLLHLDLGYNQIVGPLKSFGNLCSLKTLSLNNNSLTGQLPQLFSYLSGCSKQTLETLLLKDNILSGSLPDFTLFTSLRELQIKGNKLNGSFPKSFGQLSHLTILDLDNNNLGGSIPDLSVFVSLKELHIHGNLFNGTFPKSIGKLSKLELLDVSSNFLEDSGGIAARTVVIIVVVSVIMFVVLVALAYFILRRQKQKQIRSNQERRYYADEIDAEEALQFDFSTIKVATNDFSINGKLGQGGFGAVYKGRLSNGQDIAVKRLSNNSGQGEAEFKNEVMLVARLQHRNLVKLLGFCFEGNEKLLVYEFVPNSSLDKFIFDEAEDLLTYAWKTWQAGTSLNLIDPTLSVGSSSDIVRCIHIGLLCVQENVASRPTVASVVIMLTSSSLSLPLPSKPAFYIHTSDLHFTPFSTNDFSITQLDPR
ncbi:hypothetical protein LWI29_034954 [Acer saccharum]|uniref:Protein kinase domain-containing protein n=1 Tax=Acer saccharum TaxID=4024 RepID=A0AA39RW69_ACESA|nr:hypothetical protein LWI29_034954 [Acer saccharum]